MSTMSRTKRWTGQDDELLQELFKEKTVEQIAEEMNRHRLTILLKLKQLGLRKPRASKWTQQEIDYLKTEYPKNGIKHCAEHLKRSGRSISTMTDRLGIKVEHSYKMTDKDGYAVLIIGSSKKISEHRYVIEKFLKRKLKSTECVHHLDEVKTNNALDNLIVITPANHNTLHAAIKRKDIEVLKRIAETLSKTDRAKYEAWLEKFSRDIV